MSNNETPSRRSKITIRQIADKAGVSIATVSRVLNDHGDVSAETRESVWKVAKEYGYSIARGQKNNRTGTGLIAVTMPFTAPEYFALILAGAAEALTEHGFRIVLCPTRHDRDREKSLLEELSHGATDGALLVLPEESHEELRSLSDHGYRFVIVDPLERPDSNLPTVSAAHSSAAMQATRHLIGLGHHRIAAITGPNRSMASIERLRGYHAALAGAGIMPTQELEIQSDFLVDGGRKAARQLFRLSSPPTAIIAFNDDMAVGAMQAAREFSLSIPKDVSIVGIDDNREASLVTPPLTTVKQPLVEMGRMAVSILTRILENHQLEPLHVELATTLVVRESTGPCPVKS